MCIRRLADKGAPLITPVTLNAPSSHRTCSPTIHDLPSLHLTSLGRPSHNARTALSVSDPVCTSYTLLWLGTKYWMKLSKLFMIPDFSFGSIGPSEEEPPVTTSGNPCAWSVRRSVSPHASTSTVEESTNTT